MKLSSAWIVVEDGQRPAGLVAARTLRKRLDTVWRELTVAGGGGARDVEGVHRLRVATRRALAAIDAFRDLLPTKRAEWFTKQLRRIRRAAGEARDLDVLTERLTGESEDSGGGQARRRLVAMLSKQRAVSGQPIRLAYERLVDTWLDRVERLLAGVATGRSQPTFRTYARDRFRPMMRRFFTAADRKLRSADEIHALRIEGKQLRYAMEIFSSMFSPRMRARCYDALERLQDTLGNFTDHAAAADRLRKLAHEPSSAANRHVLERLCAREEHQADQARKAFTKWWDADRRRALRRRFEQTLRRVSA
jgi:CHAD domain-containing protein